MTPNERSAQQALLAEIFNFSPADLATNRAGSISVPQKERIANHHQTNARVAWEIFTLIFGLGLLGFSAEMIRTEQMGVKALSIYFGITAGFGLIVWALITYDRYQLQRTLRAGRVQTVEGVIGLIIERDGRIQTRYFCVGKQRFRIEYRDFASLQRAGVARQPATIYISAPRRSLLSVVLQA